MPAYEYKCEVCKYKFEEFQSIHDDPISVCPKCNGKVNKLISLSYSNVEYANPKEYYETVIKPDAHRIAEKIKAGDADAAADILGDDYVG
jgi:putative FmdB family regulatory protein